MKSLENKTISKPPKQFTFIDLFAGAGGFSEGFLQAQINKKSFEFIVANDINENCELTHVARYNHQLGLDAEFLCQDITEPDFLDNLLGKIRGKKIDIVCGGPPCQSFSLAGKRKKFDKKDTLFSHYLKVIKALKPKYFVMENVKGILTKEQGKIKEIIINEMNSIVDTKELPLLIKYVKKIKSLRPADDFVFDCVLKRLEIEMAKESDISKSKNEYIMYVESKFRQTITKIVDYKTSKTNIDVSTIRHGFNMLLRSEEWEKLKKSIIREKDFCNIDNDQYVNSFTDFLTSIEPEETIKKIEASFENLSIPKKYKKACLDIVTSLKIFNSSFESVVEYITDNCNKDEKKSIINILEKIRLYRIDKPFVANASNYGVPQNRERVLFIGCRKDQKFISEIPATVSNNEKVSVFEALYDLDFIGNNQERSHYEKIDISKNYNGTAKKMKSLIKKRSVDGLIDDSKGKTYSEWSKKGRLISKYKNSKKSFYVANTQALEGNEKVFNILNNHKTSNQNDNVIKRLKIILKEGDYKRAKEELNKHGLSSEKRNYNVLKPDGQSPTVMTIPDDYIHYNSPRALTVREMARLQSFDDSFVFQGKRSTGGNNRKSEVPQFTLVGNAIPPLLARAIAYEILKNIS